jgi:vancomycin resistance protein YoaR
VPRLLASWWRAPGWKRVATRIGVGLVGALVALVVVSIADDIRTDGEVGRNVSLAGRDVSGLDDAGLTAVVQELAASYQTTPVEIRTDAGVLETTAGDLGLQIDEAATIEEAREVGEADAALPLRPFEWLGSWFSDREAPVRFRVDDVTARQEVERLATEVDEPAVEPRIATTDGHLQLVPGRDGIRLDPDAVLRALPAGAGFRNGRFVAEVDTTPVPPRTSDAALAALVEDADRRSTAGLSLALPDEPEPLPVPSDTIAGWWLTRSSTAGTTPALTLDEEAILEDVESLVGQRGTLRNEPSFEIVDGQVRINPPAPGVTCCSPTTASDVARILLGSDPGQRVPITMRPTDPAEDVAHAAQLGIVEEVATFTTRHQCCQNRVHNIHRISDLVRGHVIKPGETFSVNDFVGRRTVEKGFLVDHVIENGEFRDDVGGGISQFATTMFNAAFFAGLDFEEYQSHTLYISRYPYGREATLSFPHPDLKITNTTPYGMLIWPTYDDVSITIGLWSTKFVDVEQSGQDQTPQDQCTRVTTHRRRTYLDGRTVDDVVRAYYYPGENLDCQGNLINTTTTTTTTTTVPESTTTTTVPGPPVATTTTVPPPPPAPAGPPVTAPLAAPSSAGAAPPQLAGGP